MTVKTSILSREPDGVGFFYGTLPDGRQLNVRLEPDKVVRQMVWNIYVGSDGPISVQGSMGDAEAFGIAYAAANPEE